MYEFLSAITAVAALIIAVRQYREQMYDKRVRQLQSLYKSSKAGRNYFHKVAKDYYQNQYGKRTDVSVEHLIFRPEWMPEQPVPLRDVELSLLEEPWRRSGNPHPRFLPTPREGYAENVRIHCAANLMNLPLFGLHEIRVQNGGVQMTLREGCYFDFFDTCEVLAAEMARDADRYILRQKDFRRPAPLKMRESLNRRGGLLQMDNRFVGIGINLFTVLDNVIGENGEKGAYFLLHRRSQNVAEGTGSFHVVPAGSFQPDELRINGHVEAGALHECIAREFQEELLGIEEFAGDPAQTGKLANAAFFKPTFLGVGLDPMNTKAEVLGYLALDMDDPKAASLFGGGELTRINRYFSGTYEGTVELVALTGANLHKYELHEQSTPAFRQILRILQRTRPRNARADTASGEYS